MKMNRGDNDAWPINYSCACYRQPVSLFASTLSYTKVTMPILKKLFCLGKRSIINISELTFDYQTPLANSTELHKTLEDQPSDDLFKCDTTSIDIYDNSELVLDSRCSTPQKIKPKHTKNTIGSTPKSVKVSGKHFNQFSLDEEILLSPVVRVNAADRRQFRRNLKNYQDAKTKSRVRTLRRKQALKCFKKVEGLTVEINGITPVAGQQENSLKLKKVSNDSFNSLSSGYCSTH